MEEIRKLKTESTDALDTLEHIRTTYTANAPDYTPPFTSKVFSLQQAELSKAKIPIETNHLSQMVFIKYGKTTFCIPGDLEKRSWELMLAKTDVQAWLNTTNILLAPHHGRENGYHEAIFDYCQPDCIILSDKQIVHETQKDMTALYANHVKGEGIIYTPSTGKTVPRKTLTTRNDGHILVSVQATGAYSFEAYVL